MTLEGYFNVTRVSEIDVSPLFIFMFYEEFQKQGRLFYATQTKQ